MSCTSVYLAGQKTAHVLQSNSNNMAQNAGVRVYCVILESLTTLLDLLMMVSHMSALKDCCQARQARQARMVSLVWTAPQSFKPIDVDPCRIAI
jgi:sulfopyruvate decarboxylase TPP-binding subunit